MAGKFTREQLNNLETSFLIELFLNQQDLLEKQSEQLDQMALQLKNLSDQIALANRNRFGRSSERMEDTAQIRFMEVDGQIVFFNEAEAVSDMTQPEPEQLIEKPRKKKHTGKQAEDIHGLEVNRIDHYLSEEELTTEFGAKGWKQLSDMIYKEYRFIPAKVMVDEHHVGVYSSKKDEHMVKAPHPKKLLSHSLVSPSIAAAIMNGKYVNAVPLYRMEQEFSRYGLTIPRVNQANWMIRLAEEYFGILYDYLHEKLLTYSCIQADETPVLVNKDGRKAGSKSYMWVYRSGIHFGDTQIVLYEYQKTRNASHPREFLKGYSGICTTDGYQVYHTLEKEKEDLTIAGCWVHMRRRFEEALSLVPKQNQPGSVLYLAMKQIQAIYREEGKLKELSAQDRLEQRKRIISPLVDAFFAYLKTNREHMVKEAKVQDAFGYAINQEKYLRVFLSHGDVPIDNNASERAIRGFCIGKKNWMMIDTINGAKSSAILYSIAETAKANNLKPYDYFEYLLEEIPQHMDDKDRGFLENLLPWSEQLPSRIRKTETDSSNG